MFKFRFKVYLRFQVLASLLGLGFAFRFEFWV